MTDAPLVLGLTLIAAYFAGSIPFGLIFTRLAGKGDIRSIGSGNIGTTNVLRTGSKSLAALTLIFDAGKGAAIVLVVLSHTDQNIAAAAGVAAVIGHCFPIWLSFKGGKGVATSLAVYAAYDIKLGGLFILAWLTIAFLFRYSSAAALGATLLTTVGAVVLGVSGGTVLAIGVISALVWMRHHENIGRLLSGTESKIGKK